MLPSKAFSLSLWHYLDLAKGSDKFIRAAVNLYDLLADCSEDQRKDVAAWIVSKGRGYYDEVLQHPERVPPEICSEVPDLANVTADVLWERFGEEMP